MKRSFLLIGIIFLAAVSETVAEQSSGTIPLDQIWGYNLLGTKDIAGIPLPEKPGFGQSLEFLRRQREYSIEQLRRALTAKPPTERAAPGFVLSLLADFQTLQRASHAARGMLHEHPKVVGVVGEKFPRDNTFRAGKDMTLVFFTHPASYYVRLREIRREGKEFIVKYEFEPHASPEVTVHFALIPLGKLEAGEYHVRFEQIPLAQHYRDAGFEPVEPEASTIVCRSFSFNMWEPADLAPAEGATLIPLHKMWGYNIRGTREVQELEPISDPPKSDEELNEFASRSNIWKIAKVLANLPNEGEKAGPAFIVRGTGKVALENTEAVFTSGKKASSIFPSDADLSLVFYSHLCGRYVRLRGVELSLNQITIKYQFVAHHTTEMTKHFALVPLGQLPEGVYEVKIEQLEPVDEQGRPVRPVADPERYVSDSFSFEVRNEE